MIKFFNTFSGQLEEFKPLSAKEIRMYTCGPTVYDFAHIGNYRTFVFEDLLRRFLQYQGFEVKHVMNITDVDDKTIARSNSNVGAGLPHPKGEESSPLPCLKNYTQQYIDAFNEDLKALNILHPTTQPKATDEIPAMVELIKKLVDAKKAYVSEDGSVYYRVDSFRDYGKLSKKDLKQNIKGVRVDVDEYEKEESADFALWKAVKEGEPSWDSPWGKGRPGWHIECSAMSMKYLGETFDIHAGGEDLIFPHHENEIAQSEGATGKPFVRYWLHAKHLLVNGEKMSKSKGNFYTLRDLLAKGYDPIVIRFSLLSGHYRSQLNFTFDGLVAAKESLKRIRDFWFERSLGSEERQKGSGKARQLLKIAENNVIAELENDLNTAGALGVIFTFISSVNKLSKQEIGSDENREIDHFFNQLDSIFGILEAFKIEIPDEIKEVVEKRQAAREKKDYKTADELRTQIRKKGFILEDTRSGPKIKKLI